MKKEISTASVLKDMARIRVNYANSKTQHFKGGYIMKARHRAVLLVAASVFLLPLTAHSEIRAGSTEINVFGGYNWFEDNQNLKDQPVFGARLGYNFSRHWGVEGVVEFIDSEVDDKARTGLTEGQYGSPIDNVDLTFYHIDAIYHFMPDSNFTPFVAVGLGGAHYNPEISDDDMAAFNFGIGAKYQLTDNIFLRADLRDYMVSEIFQENYHNFAATIGLTIAFGGRAKPAPERVVKRAARPVPKPAPMAEKTAVVLVSEPEAEKKVEVVAVKAKVVVLAFEDIHFDFDKATLKPEAKRLLKKNIQILKKNPKAQIRVAGYTSAMGTKAYNQDLSVRRAKAVEDYLIEEGFVTPERLSTIGFGETRPTAYEEAPEKIYSKAAKANMRVLFQVVIK
jgi:OOP family OmpA-OmpF porin